MSSGQTTGEVRPDGKLFVEIPGGAAAAAARLPSCALRDGSALSKAANWGILAFESGPIGRIPVEGGCGNPCIADIIRQGVDPPALEAAFRLDASDQFSARPQLLGGGSRLFWAATNQSFARYPGQSAILMSNKTQVVILIHGIRDFALWQYSIRSTLEEAGLVVEATNYGRFNLVEFLLPLAFFRKRSIEQVWRQIRIVRQNNPDADISVIAHSFGTYVVAQLLKENFDIKFHRIIFCGSVVPYDFPFEQIQDRFRPPIVNEVGTRDIWPAMAESITLGYGSAGTYGFRRPLVRDRWHNGAGHNFFLTEPFCEQFWVPLLTKGELLPGAEIPEAPRLWIQLVSVVKIRWFLYVVILWIVAGSLFAGVTYLLRWQKVRLDAPAYQSQLDRTVGNTIEPKIAPPQTYCSDLKEVMASVPTRFAAILGRHFGDNRIAVVTLSDWEDCIVHMENQFTNERSYHCTLSGFGNVAIATQNAEEIAKGIVAQCLGRNFSYNKVAYPDGPPRFRVVGRGTNATVTLRPFKDMLSPNWNISLDVD